MIRLSSSSLLFVLYVTKNCIQHTFGYGLLEAQTDKKDEVFHRTIQLINKTFQIQFQSNEHCFTEKAPADVDSTAARLANSDLIFCTLAAADADDDGDLIGKLNFGCFWLKIVPSFGRFASFGARFTLFGNFFFLYGVSSGRYDSDGLRFRDRWKFSSVLDLD